MQLTNKTKSSYFWREAGNRLFIEIDGKPFELKYTVAQNEAYQHFIDEQKSGSDAKSEDPDKDLELSELFKKRISKNLNYATSVLGIALNSKREKQFTTEQIMELFEEHLDLMQIVSHTYIDKKIFNPILDATLDPHLAPGSRGA